MLTNKRSELPIQLVVVTIMRTINVFYVGVETTTFSDVFQLTGTQECESNSEIDRYCRNDSIIPRSHQRRAF